MRVLRLGEADNQTTQTFQPGHRRMWDRDSVAYTGRAEFFTAFQDTEDSILVQAERLCCLRGNLSKRAPFAGGGDLDKDMLGQDDM